MNEELYRLLGIDPAAAREEAMGRGLLGAIFQAAALSGQQPRPVSTAQALGQVGLAGMGAYESAFDKTLKDALTGIQLKDLVRKQADEERIRKARETFESRISGATSMQPTRQGVLDTQSNIDPMLLEQMSAQDVISAAPKTQQVVDQTAADRAVMDYLRIASPTEYAKLVAKEPRALPSAIQEYQYAVSQGYKGTFTEYQEQMKKAGATNINMPTEGERKAGFLASRVRFGLEQMSDVIGKNPPSASPEALPTLVKFLTQSDFLSNKLTSPDRQRIESAQLDILDAALTLGTGAAYTREQIESYRKSYFPQLGDDQKTIVDKQKRLQNLLESSYISAGRSAPTGLVPSITQPPMPAPQFNSSDLNLINKYLPPKK